MESRVQKGKSAIAVPIIAALPSFIVYSLCWVIYYNVAVAYAEGWDKLGVFGTTVIGLIFSPVVFGIVYLLAHFLQSKERRANGRWGKKIMLGFAALCIAGPLLYALVIWVRYNSQT